MTKRLKDFLERIEMEVEMEKFLKDQERLEHEKEQERLAREKEIQFELEKLKLMNATDSGNNISMPRKVSLKDLVSKFDPKQIDILLLMMIFKRQAKREKLNEES